MVWVVLNGLPFKEHECRLIEFTLRAFFPTTYHSSTGSIRAESFPVDAAPSYPIPLALQFHAVLGLEDLSSKQPVGQGSSTYPFPSLSGGPQRFRRGKQKKKAELSLPTVSMMTATVTAAVVFGAFSARCFRACSWCHRYSRTGGASPQRDFLLA